MLFNYNYVIKTTAQNATSSNTVVSKTYKKVGETDSFFESDFPDLVDVDSVGSNLDFQNIVNLNTIFPQDIYSVNEYQRTSSYFPDLVDPLNIGNEADLFTLSDFSTLLSPKKVISESDFPDLVNVSKNFYDIIDKVDLEGILTNISNNILIYNIDNIPYFYINLGSKIFWHVDPIFIPTILEFCSNF